MKLEVYLKMLPQKRRVVILKKTSEEAARKASQCTCDAGKGREAPGTDDA